MHLYVVSIKELGHKNVKVFYKIWKNFAQKKLLFNEKEAVRSLNGFPKIDFVIKESRKDTKNVHFYGEKATLSIAGVIY